MALSHSLPSRVQLRALLMLSTVILAPLATEGAESSAAPARRTELTPAVVDAGERAVTLAAFRVEENSDSSYGALNSNSVTQFNLELFRLPVSADIFTETLMRDLAATSVEDMIMEHTAGAGLALSSPAVPTTEPLDRNAESSISLRGLYVPNYQRDGLLPLNTYSTSSTTGTGFTSNFDMERVEVLRGPQSLLYGSGGGGGVINHVSKRARLGKPAAGSLKFSVDQYGHKLGQIDFGAGNTRLAVRLAAIRQTTGGRRVNIGGPLAGEYLQVAVSPFKSTVIRFSGTQTRYETRNPWTPTLVAASSANDARNGMNLHYLLATRQMEASGSGPSGAGPIGNGKVTWDNVDSYGGVHRSEKTDSRFGTVVAETQWADWLSTSVSAGYKDYHTRLTAQTAGLIAPNVATNPTGSWAVMRAAGAAAEDWRGAQTKAVRFAVQLDHALFAGRVRSQTVVGADYSRVKPFFELKSYFEVGTTPRNSAGQLQNNRLPAFYWDVGNGPVEHVLFPVFSDRITAAGKEYYLDTHNPPLPQFVSPANPLGVQPNGGSFYRLRTDTRGIFAANSSEWLQGRLNTLAGFRLAGDDQERVYEGVAPSAGDPDTYTTIRRRTRNRLGLELGGNYALRPWLRLYAAVSSSHNPMVVQRNDPVGDSPVSGDALGEELGLKVQNASGSISGSISGFHVASRNEQVQTSLRNFINPAGLNGDHRAPGTWYNVDRVVRGLEVALTAAPRPNLRLRVAGAWTDGEIQTNAVYPQLYNDQFHANSAGQVTYRNGTVVYVNPNAINANSPTVPASTPGAVPLTIAMMNSPANLYYANPVQVTGQINGSSNAARVLRVIDPVAGPILTGATGLPISGIQINPGFTPPGSIVVGDKGDKTVGHPEFSLSTTTMYTFSESWRRGFRLGATAAWAAKVRGFYYYPVAATPGADRELYWRPDRFNFNLITGFQRKWGRYHWSLQLNVNNLFNDYRVVVLPAAVGGFSTTANAVFSAQPRAYVFTSTVSF